MLSQTLKGIRRTQMMR